MALIEEGVLVTQFNDRPGFNLLEAPIEETAHHHLPIDQLKKFCGRVALASLAFVGAGIVGTMIRPAHTTFGPHIAEIKPTLTSDVELDFGALGSIIKPVNLPGDLGAHIDIKEIPADIDSGSEGQLDFTEEDIDNYARLLSDYDTDVNKARKAVLENGLKFGILGDVGAMGLFLLLGKKRREELTQGALQILSNKTVAVAVAGGLLLAPFVIDSQATSASNKAIEVSNAFDGTVLEDATIEGRWLQVAINKYGTEIVDRVKENNNFYDGVLADLKTEVSTSEVMQAGDNEEILLFYTDLHCNVGMGEVFGEISHVNDASIAIDGGDTAGDMAIDNIENWCIQTAEDHINDGSKKVAVVGNHASDTTNEQLHKVGFTVLEGDTKDVGGNRFLGDSDPRISRFGQTIRQNRPETVEEMGQRLADIACTDPEGVDVLTIHDPEATQETIERGCAKLVLSGHLHKEKITMSTASNGQKVLHINGASAGGAVDNGTTLGPLQSEARVYAIKMDRTLNQPIQYQIISVDTDGKVTFQRPVYVHQTSGLTTHQYSSGPLNVR